MARDVGSSISAGSSVWASSASISRRLIGAGDCLELGEAEALVVTEGVQAAH